MYILKYTSLRVCVRSVWTRVCMRLCFVLLHNLQLNLQLTRPSQLALNFIIYAICWQTTQDVDDDDDDDDDAAGHGTKDTQNECLRLPYARGALKLRALCMCVCLCASAVPSFTTATIVAD